MEPITLSTERLILRVLEERDIDAVHAACQDPEIPRWTPVPSPYRRQHAEDFVRHTSADGWSEDVMYNFGVFTREGALVSSMGLVRLGSLYTAQHQAELGYWTAKEQRGRGYTVEAARAVIAWAFDDLGVERLEWVAEKGNVASRAVAERLGFTIEGTLRGKIVHNGTRRDAWIGSLLPSDWQRASGTPYLPVP
jgi:RimJ/RimL family protein N-acetyltransferase